MVVSVVRGVLISFGMGGAERDRSLDALYLGMALEYCRASATIPQNMAHLRADTGNTRDNPQRFGQGVATNSIGQCLPSCT